MWIVLFLCGVLIVIPLTVVVLTVVTLTVAHSHLSVLPVGCAWLGSLPGRKMPGDAQAGHQLMPLGNPEAATKLEIFF